MLIDELDDKNFNYLWTLLSESLLSGNQETLISEMNWKFMYPWCGIN